MITAVLSFCGVIIGASLQYIFTRYLENQRHYRTLRTQAYMDYLKAVSEQANLRTQPEPARIQEIFTNTADAKARICLYGATAVIEAFAHFEKIGASMKTDEGCDAFISMVAEMRKDSGGASSETLEELGIVLLGQRKTAA